MTQCCTCVISGRRGHTVSAEPLNPAATLLVVTQASDLPLRTIKRCSIVFGVTLKLLVIHPVVVSRHQQTPPLTSDYSVINSPWSVAAECIALGAHSTRRSQILAQNRDFCLPHLHSTPPLGGSPYEYCHDVWYVETRMIWLPVCEKFCKI